LSAIMGLVIELVQQNIREKGRPSSIDATKVRELKQKGLGASEIAKALKIGRASVYRALLTVP